MYPDLAMRELIANMLVHQEFTVTGAGPTVEIFHGRVEVTNPGAPLVPKDRFIDSAPISRNERLARVMRLVGVCEERGSGWDKIAFQVELHQLPAPLIEATKQYTRVVMFEPRPLGQMQKDERVRAVYLHACLRAVTHLQTTNSSVRERFNLAADGASTASRILRDAVEAGLIVPVDPTVGSKAMSYVPHWATGPAD